MTLTQPLSDNTSRQSKNSPKPPLRHAALSNIGSSVNAGGVTKMFGNVQ